jgi:hypothetical protein
MDGFLWGVLRHPRSLSYLTSNDAVIGDIPWSTADSSPAFARKFMKTFTRDSQWPSPEWNQAPLKYESTVLPLDHPVQYNGSCLRGMS